MSNLYNQYISQSYQGLLHFDNNNSASATLTAIQNGLGQDLGLYLNNSGDLKTTTSISSSLIETTKLVVKNKIELTGSVDILGSVTASNAYITNNLIVSGTISAYQINTTIESSSVIFSSGSNILGDATNDTQTLNGTIIMSGSSQLTGSMGISANLNVLGNISSSTLSGVGNVTAYSASVNGRLVYLEQPFSQSVSAQLIALQNFTGSQGLTTTSSFNAYTASTNADLNSIHQTTASLNISTASLNAYTQSNTTNLNTLSSSIATRFTYTPTTGSNAFVGDQFITGVVFISSSAVNDFNVIGGSIFSGSVRGLVIPLTITSQTASMDCSLGNFFTLTLASGSNTTLNATNILPGETISLRVTQPSNAGTTTGTLTWVSSIKFPQAFPYFATPITGAVDILSFQSYDTSSLYGVGVNTMV